MNICNMYDKTKEIDKLIKIFKNNKGFYIFYDEEKEETFLRKNKKNYTGKYEEIKNSIESDFSSDNYHLSTYFHKESGFYENGKREGIFIYEFFDSNIKFEVNYKNGEKEGKYSIYRFSKRQNKIVRIYEEGEFHNNEKILVTQYYYNRKDELEIKTIDFKNFQEVLSFRDGTKIVKEVFRYRTEMISFNLPISSTDRGILKAYQYKDDKLKSEAFFSAGILKKIIYYNGEENIESMNYFDIYYDNDIKEFNSFCNFRDKKDLFEDSLLNRKNLKIYDYKNEKYIDYPDIFINGDNDIKLQLKILKDDVNLNTNFGYNDNDLIPLPKYTEYFDKNGKIYKRDFYKIEKVINYWGTTFESVLEKTEYYFENSENIKTEEVNKRVYLDYDFNSKFIKILLKE
ncbi:hypothetical protein [Fusobacterium sp. CM22]|uniref:hypothetical protein n=1 Tax=Fusobacterium sp. CM22 TaxID=936563 RepID=UPI00044B433A|nr:hypothetical protein [Fusobacterium sp. CM22]EUB21344.1 hypothetical protein HMPREF1500_1980 [Fusobacterium sp. CM22]